MNTQENDKNLKYAVKQAALDDMKVLRQRRHDNIPKVLSKCSVRDCPGVPVKKLTIKANTVLGEQTSEINVCKEHLSELNNTSHFSMGCKIG